MMLAHITVTYIKLSDQMIQITSLGVTVDSTLAFDAHVTALCKECYFHLRSVRHIRRSPSICEKNDVGLFNAIMNDHTHILEITTIKSLTFSFPRSNNLHLSPSPSTILFTKDSLFKKLSLAA